MIFIFFIFCQTLTYLDFMCQTSITKNQLVYKATNGEVPHKLWSIRMVILATYEFFSQCKKKRSRGDKINTQMDSTSLQKILKILKLNKMVCSLAGLFSRVWPFAEKIIWPFNLHWYFFNKSVLTFSDKIHSTHRDASQSNTNCVVFT